jgi:carbonic anhydrase
MEKNGLNLKFSLHKMMLNTLLALSIIASGCKSPAKNYDETPMNALEQLQAGNRRFVQHHARHPHQSAARVTETAAGQKPYAVVITCSDSRVSPEIIFDQGIGDLFVIRNAGNIVEEEDVLASVEYVVEHLGVRTVVVMGHEHCGAIEAMIHATQEDEPEHVIAILQRLRNEPEEQQALRSGDTGEQLVHRCVSANVEHGVAALNQQLHHLKGHSAGADVSVVGAVYDIQTGVVHFQVAKSSLH